MLLKPIQKRKTVSFFKKNSSERKNVISAITEKIKKTSPPKETRKKSSFSAFSIIKRIILFFISLGILFIAGVFIWISTIHLPDFNDFENRVVRKSTQIYDRTGKTLLYNIHKDFKRTVIPFADMGENVKKATIALEDDKFYSHHGIRPLAILRAVYANTITGSVNQGGSTITQQIVKNTLLSSERTITRKIKEWVLALKIEKRLTKDQILEVYLNESPYGGTVYGVEQASQTYFGKPAKELTLAEAAYVASIPQRPTYFLPFGKNNAKLLERKDFALARMKILGMITDQEYTEAKMQEIKLVPGIDRNIKAPHFVFYIEEYLNEKFGEERVEEGGLKVITTLDLDLQKKAEEIVKKRALENKTAYNAENMGMVGIDPKNSQILFMVGSRDYFDKDIDGAYNIATANRQPGSSFKPFVYALAFEKGYLPETMMFDVPTEFSPNCNPDHTPKYPGAACYGPKNYTGTFFGKVSMKKALGSSLNIPAVQTLYLVGVQNAIKFAQSLGISTLSTNENYGLSLVLGGAEVKLVEMVNAYGVFANGGSYKKETGILSIKNSDGEILEEYKDEPGKKVIEENTAYKISDILSDDKARQLVFLPGSALQVQGKNVAAKTGTTNNNKDAWIVGYTQSLVIGVWSGNNNAKPMTDTGSTVSGPAWNEMFRYVLNNLGNRFPDTPFPEPLTEDNYDEINPIIRGELPSEGYHSSIYYINKSDPRGPKPTNPANDPQYLNWEAGIDQYFAPVVPEEIPTDEGEQGVIETPPQTTPNTVLQQMSQ